MVAVDPVPCKEHAPLEHLWCTRPNKTTHKVYNTMSCTIHNCSVSVKDTKPISYTLIILMLVVTRTIVSVVVKVAAGAQEVCRSWRWSPHAQAS